MTKKAEFEGICSDILNNKSFKALNKEPHHGITRYDHSLRVAKLTYKVGKFLHIKSLKSTTRAALLHDFFLNKEMANLSPVEKLSAHPMLALNNAKKYYHVNALEKDIIVNHMYPVTKVRPKTKQGILVSLTDKLVATYEMCRYKINFQISILFILLLNLINIQK
jgi:uncharacterized protein